MGVVPEVLVGVVPEVLVDVVPEVPADVVPEVPADVGAVPADPVVAPAARAGVTGATTPRTCTRT